MLEIIIALIVIFSVVILFSVGCTTSKYTIRILFGKAVMDVSEIGFYIIGISTLILHEASVIPIMFYGELSRVLSPMTVLVALMMLMGVAALTLLSFYIIVVAVMFKFDGKKTQYVVELSIRIFKLLVR